MRSYEEYKISCKKIKNVNHGFLTDFKTWLISMGLATKTIEKHISNVDCFINDYLLYEDAIEAIDGVHHVSMYFEYWIIKKSAWASPNSIKSGAASIKKFYAFMAAKNLVKQEDLDSLAKTIKDEMPTWLSMMKSYDQNIFEMDDDY